MKALFISFHLILFSALMILLIRSLFWRDIISRMSVGQSGPQQISRDDEFRLQDGVMSVSLMRLSMPLDQIPDHRTHSTWYWQAEHLIQSQWSLLFTSTVRGWSVTHYARGPIGQASGDSENEWAISLPLLPLLLISLIYPLLALRGSVRRRDRINDGLCTKCGYDLRASGDECPECGQKIR